MTDDTPDELGELSDNGESDIVVTEPARLDRVVTEILDPVDYYDEGESPEGPWSYRTLRVTRVGNDIYVYDVDGEMCDHLVVPDLSTDETVDDPHTALQTKLDEINEESLAAL